MKKFIAAAAALALTSAAFAQFTLSWSENVINPAAATDGQDPLNPATSWSGDLTFTGATNDVVWNAHEINFSLSGPGAAGATFYNHLLGGDQRSPGLEGVFPAIAYDTYNIPRPGNSYLQSPANVGTAGVDVPTLTSSFSSPPLPASEAAKTFLRLTVQNVDRDQLAFVDWSGQLSYIPGAGQSQQIVPVSGSLQIGVPEPASLSLLALAALGLIRRR